MYFLLLFKTNLPDEHYSSAIHKTCRFALPCDFTDVLIYVCIFQGNNRQPSPRWFKWRSLHIAPFPPHNEAVAPFGILDWLETYINSVLYLIPGYDAGEYHYISLHGTWAPQPSDISAVTVLWIFLCQFMMCVFCCVNGSWCFVLGFGIFQYCLFVVFIYLCSVAGRVWKKHRQSGTAPTSPLRM